MSSPTYANCAEHPTAVASLQCDGCKRLLCYACVEEGHRLTLCKHCGERAHGLEESWQLTASSDTEERMSAAGMPVADLLYEERPEEIEPLTMAEDPLTLVFNHVVVPAAAIAMVASLLFFLLDVRSLFLEGSANLKWLGFWFAFASVLIARYGKVAGQQDRVGCYATALMLATLVALYLGPWQRQDPSWHGPLVNGVILYGVWRFATALTSGLALEGQEHRRRGRRLYGLERLTFEAWRRYRGDSVTEALQGAQEASPTTDLRTPSRDLARLAAMVMVLFALGEPALLRGPPEVAVRGFSSMVVFLLACGVLLGAAAGLDVFRRVRHAGGKMSSTHLPRRALAAGVAMVVLLAIAVAMPGVRQVGEGQGVTSWQGADAPSEGSASGQGEQRSGGSDEPGSGSGPDGGQAGQPSEATSRAAPRRAGNLESSAGDPQGPTSQLDATSDGSSANPWRASSALLEVLTTLGRWLRIPVLLAVVILGLLALRRLLPLLGGWRGLWRSGGVLWQRLKNTLSLMGLWRRGPTAPSAPGRLEPWRGVEDLAALPPEQAVHRAYGHLLLLLDALGHERPQYRTPNELLAGLPRRFHALQPTAARLTEIYVAAAYGPGEVTPEAQRAALRQVEQLRRLSQPLLSAV